MTVLTEYGETCPVRPEFLNNLAWALATNPLDSERDGARAVELAQRAVSLMANEDPAYLDTLAAAHAEAGDFAAAIRHQKTAIRRLETASAPAPVLAIFKEHLREFESQRPLRD